MRKENVIEKLIRSTICIGSDEEKKEFEKFKERAYIILNNALHKSEEEERRGRENESRI